MIPALFFSGFHLDRARLANPVCLFHLIFLGMGASAFCFVAWNFAVQALGAVRTSSYIYLVPVITLIASSLVLGERITVLAAAGTALTLAGLALSEQKIHLRKREKQDGLAK